MNKQNLRNKLTEIEDEARVMCADPAHDNSRLAFDLIARLVQVIRQEIVK